MDKPETKTKIANGKPKREYKKKRLTQRQRVLQKKISENLGKKKPKPMGELMKEAGYSEATSKTPTLVTQTKSWQELVNEKLPDGKLLEKLNVLLDARKKTRTYIKGDLQTEYEEEDNNAIGKGLDMSFKIKGKYAPTEVKIIDENENLSDDEIALKIAELEKKRHRVKPQKAR